MPSFLKPNIAVKMLKSKILNLLLGKVSYISGTNQQFSFNETVDGNKFTLQDSGSDSWLIIVGRQNYSESIRTYPIPEEKEALKAAKFDDADDTEHRYFYDAVKLDEQQCSVTVWAIENVFIEKYCKKAILLLPESLLVSRNNQLTELSIDETSSTFFARSRKGYASYQRDSFVDSAETFCQLAEIALPETTKQINADNLWPEIVSGLDQSLFSKLHRFLFLSKSGVSQNNIPYKQMGITAAAVVLGYNILLSGFLTWQASSLQQEFVEKREQVDEVLSFQTELADQIELNQLLSEKLTIDDTPWRAFEVVSSLVNAGMQITNISYRGGEYRVAGLADKATQMLGLVSEHNTVTEASFAGPVRESRNGERFGINFKTKGFE